MGIPAAFRWLSSRYPKIISPVIEEKPTVLEDGTVIPADTTQPNPNGEEFDNLYLDMNGIVHPCSHPEDRPAPKDEEEMMIEVFKYTDRVVNMVRPRRLLMIAVDGVAPRAKMNQQRSRRFRAAQEAKEKEQNRQEEIKKIQKELGKNAQAEPIEMVVKKAFDSNSITPGTPFMDILAASLRYWVAYKLNTDPAWANLKVIISDATVPGEGEHKIMNFIRSQRNSPDHDPNTRHVIYGLDADLIMLGLATHEPHFRVLREDVFAQEAKVRLCKICGQKGHDERNCRGEAKKKEGEFDEKDHALPLKPFIWLHVSVLREYLAVELYVPNLPFRWDLERAIDDWVFMCFFVGNDFLPHLPALEIRENGIDTLTAIWKDNLPIMGGYVTHDGQVNLERAQYILSGLAKQEDAIFRRRKEVEDRREASHKRRKLQEERRANGKGGAQDSPLNNKRKVAPEANGPPPGMNLFSVTSIPSPVNLTHDMVMKGRSAVDQANLANKSAASVLKSQLLAARQAGQQNANGETPKKDGDSAPDAVADTKTPPSALGKRKAELIEDDATSTGGSSDHETPAASGDEGPVDTVRLWEEGYADRYYEQKFKVDPKDIEFRHKVARAYVEGLAWVLKYYFQGCPSWEWFYPYHYAPFAADFVDLGKMTIKFEKGRISRPFEQLMSVLPAASRHAIPEVFHDLMTHEDSPILDFYPEEFEIDLNGKKMAWQGVALLPFIEMPRLLAAMKTREHLLSPEDQARNEPGKDVLLISDAHPLLYDDITAHFYSKKKGSTKFTLDPKRSGGLSGTVEKIEGYVPHGSLVYPLERNIMPDVDYDRSLSVTYHMPLTSSTHKSMLLRGVKLPPPALTRDDVDAVRNKARNAGRSYGGAPLRNGNGGGRNDRINYAAGPPPPPSGSYYPPDRGYNNNNNNGYGGGYASNNRYAPPPPPGYGSAPGYGYTPSGLGWQPPPPPGYPGFGIGAPPPPPPAHLAGGSYGGSYGAHGYPGGGGGYRDNYAPPPPPPRGGGYQQQYGGGGGGGQQYRPPQNQQHQQQGRDGRYDGRRDDRRGGGGGGYGRDSRDIRRW
ncbi:hypothetical protein VTJ04DRAFT_9145 [Mycothermus thermophilus]|uniref:uncharacterized protein n=1 Tax=Humicola insolens TaxID=85995 RepID=UPI003744887C